MANYSRSQSASSAVAKFIIKLKSDNTSARVVHLDLVLSSTSSTEVGNTTIESLMRIFEVGYGKNWS